MADFRRLGTMYRVFLYAESGPGGTGGAPFLNDIGTVPMSFPFLFLTQNSWQKVFRRI